MYSVRRAMSLATIGAAVLCAPAHSEEQHLSLPYFVDPKPEEVFVFQRPLKRYDVAIAGETVIIDSELRTNGGNVVIVADRLILNAPINTRVYSTMEEPFWERDEDGDAWDSSLVGFLRFAEKALDPFSNYYLWYDYYDPETRSYRYRAASREQIDKGDVRIAIMPFELVPVARGGTLPPRDGNPTDGRDAPSKFDRNAFRSGNITVYARTIEFCPDCIRRQFESPEVTGGDPFDAETVKFFNAAGAKGGRGGLGTPFPCLYNTPGGPLGGGRVGVRCDEVFDRPGGLSGLPGRGGDAGDVHINFVGAPELAEQERRLQQQLDACAPTKCEGADFPAVFGQSLAALTDVSGGPPSHVARLRTPSFNTLMRNSGRVVFKPDQVAPGPVADLTGAHGKLVIQSTNPEEALGQVAVALSALDANPKYDLQEVMQSIEEDGNTDSPIARDLLASFLTEMLVRRQLDLLATLPEAIDSQHESALRFDLLSPLTCSGRTVVGLVDLEFEIVRRICEFRTYPGEINVLRSYFYRTGGLFRPAEITTGVDFQAERAIAELQRANVALNRIRQEITTLNSMFYDFMTDQVRQRYKEQLLSLSNVLEAANAALAAQGDVVSHLLAIGKQAEGSAKSAFAGWSSGNYVAVAGSVAEAGGHLVKFFAIVNGADLTQSQREAVDKIKQQIVEVERQFQLFEQETALMKERLLGRQLASLRDFLLAKASIRNSRRIAVFDFESLLRGALILYLSDPFRQQDQLVSSTRAIRDVLLNFPNQTLSFLPPRIRVDCQGQAPAGYTELPAGRPVGCVAVDAERRTYALISTGGRLRRFPLLVVAAGSGSYLASFNWLFRPEEVASRLTGAEVRGWKPDESALALP